MNPKNLQTGDVLHCRGNGIIAKLIMWATKSYWSHTAVFIEIWGQPFVLEAQAKGVHAIPYYEWLKKYAYEFEVSRNDYLTDHKLWAVHAMSKLGTTGYDFVSLLIRQPRLLLTGRWKKQKFEEDRMYCSEYALWTHAVEKAYRMSPQQVYDYCGTVEGWTSIEEEY
jgi:hypothetical protein